MQREEKQIENAIDVILSRVTELKNSVIHLLFKMDHESDTLNWPTVLDNFALISSQADGESLLILEKNQEKLVSNIKEFYPWLCAFQNGDDILYSNDSVSNDENPVPKFLLDDLDQSVNQEPEEESPPEPFRQIPAAPTSVNRKQFPVRRKVKSSLFNFREQKILLMKKESTIKMRHLNEEHELKMELMKCDIELKRVQIEIAKKELAKM